MKKSILNHLRSKNESRSDSTMEERENVCRRAAKIVQVVAVVVAMASMFCGCKKEEATLPQLSIPTTISVPSNAKTTLEEGEVHWSERDEIAVVKGNSSSDNPIEPFTLTSGAGTSGATFTGVVHRDGSEPYYAVYPLKSFLSVNEGVAYVEAVRHRQTLRSGSFGDGDNVSVGMSHNTTMSFMNVGGLAKLMVSGEAKVSSISIVSYDNQILSGRGFIDLNESIPTIQWMQPIADEANTFSSVIADASGYNEGISVSGGEVFYIVMPPVTLHKYTVSITDEKGVVTNFPFSDTSVTINRARIKNLGTFKVETVTEIYYAAQERIDPEVPFGDAILVSNEFSGGKGRMRFNKVVREIPSMAFSYTSLNSINLPEEIVSIGMESFSGCGSLEWVSISPQSQLQAIAPGAFLNCSSLETVTIPQAVGRIGSQAFMRTGLRDVYCYPMSAPVVAEDAFSMVPETAVLHLKKGATGYDEIGWPGIISYDL